MVLIERLTPLELRLRSPPILSRDNHDTIFLITTSTPFRTPTPHVCPRCLPHGLEISGSYLAHDCIATPAGSQYSCSFSLLRSSRRFKTHSTTVPKRLPSSRCIKNAPALTHSSAPVTSLAGAFPIQH